MGSAGAVFGTGFRYFYRLPNFMKSFACDNICSWYKNCEIVKIKNQCLSAFFPWQHVPLSDQFTSTVLAFYSICNRFWQLNFETGPSGFSRQREHYFVAPVIMVAKDVGLNYLWNYSGDCGTQGQAESKVSQNYIHMITEEAHMVFYHPQICRRHLSLRSWVTLNWLSHYSVFFYNDDDAL
ncbi:hypothetical protein TRIUR3_19275 [Triticum urartu]|uniref:Uncharacterized protein n=1 Tax=Triticum urartu TaxID=4572 RepID=M7Z7X9_TRIUA|nr:hypothetical protein TRIUR3_19275 [Triticum urartu]